MSWQDIIKEFKPDSDDNEYYQLIGLLDYTIANYPDRADNAEKVKKDLEEILDTYYKEIEATITNTENKLNALSQYITRGNSKTLRDTWDSLIIDLMERLQ